MNNIDKPKYNIRDRVKCAIISSNSIYRIIKIIDRRSNSGGYYIRDLKLYGHYNYVPQDMDDISKSQEITVNLIEFVSSPKKPEYFNV